MQEILGLVRRCVEDYDMIQSGDTVAVGVSGGKDSLLTLTALARLSRFYPKPFRVVAMTIEAGTPGMSFDGVADYCRALGVEYIRVSVPIYVVVCLTLVCVVFIAKLVGCSLPILAEKLGFDPAVMASPFITTIVDALSLFIYFKIAGAILGV